MVLVSQEFHWITPDNVHDSLPQMIRMEPRFDEGVCGVKWVVRRSWPRQLRTLILTPPAIDNSEIQTRSAYRRIS